jgi:hypothetical protein
MKRFYLTLGLIFCFALVTQSAQATRLMQDPVPGTAPTLQEGEPKPVQIVRAVSGTAFSRPALYGYNQAGQVVIGLERDSTPVTAYKLMSPSGFNLSRVNVTPSEFNAIWGMILSASSSCPLELKLKREVLEGEIMVFVQTFSLPETCSSISALPAYPDQG